jgi:nucleoside-diphosphate-sugar epimerase
VQDVAGALVALLDGKVTGVCNIGSGLPVSAHELVTFIARIMAAEDLLRFDASGQRSGEPASIVADTRRLRDELGWQPRLTLKEGLTRTITWWRSNLRS